MTRSFENIGEVLPEPPSWIIGREGMRRASESMWVAAMPHHASSDAMLLSSPTGDDVADVTLPRCDVESC
jgi:hypothetical protein